MAMRNHFDEARERREQDGTEYKFGAVQVSLFNVPVAERDKYQPIGEVQRGRDDTQDCASRDKVNILETKLNYAYRNNLLHPFIKSFFDENGYTVWRNGVPYIECSDAYIGIKSGTTRQGNSLKAPAQAVHQWGLIPKKMLPLEEWMTWEDYHAKTRITKEMEALGKQFLKYLPISYEQVPLTRFEQALLDGELSGALYAWPFPDENGIYQRSPNNFNHAIKIMYEKWYIQDNYLDSHDSDFIKHLAPDYRFFDWGYQMHITGQNAEISMEELNLLQKLLQQLYDLLVAMQKAGIKFGKRFLGL